DGRSLPLPSARRDYRGAVVADLDGDGTSELLITAAPDHTLVARHTPDGVAFMALRGVLPLAASDVDGDGDDEGLATRPGTRSAVLLGLGVRRRPAPPSPTVGSLDQDGFPMAARELARMGIPERAARVLADEAPLLDGEVAGRARL